MPLPGKWRKGTEVQGVRGTVALTERQGKREKERWSNEKTIWGQSRIIKILKINKLKKLIIITSILSLFISVYGQDESLQIPSSSRMNVGFGIGRDYGGLGGRLTFLPTARLAVFGAVGYNLIGIGLNGGAYYRISPGKKICPFVGAMYGYNAVIKVTGSIEFKKVYYGPTFSIGTELWSFMKRDYFNIELVIPLTPSEYKADYDELKDMGVEFRAPSIPVGFSLGYHLAF